MMRHLGALRIAAFLLLALACCISPNFSSQHRALAQEVSAQESKAGLDTTESPANAEASVGAITLVIDYSNGAQKIFSGISFRAEVMAVLKAAASLRPGLDFDFASSFIDRGGREVGTISSIDGVRADGENHRWLIFINQKFEGAELRIVTPESVTKFGQPAVEPGDFILIKLATGP